MARRHRLELRVQCDEALGIVVLRVALLHRGLGAGSHIAESPQALPGLCALLHALDSAVGGAQPDEQTAHLFEVLGPRRGEIVVLFRIAREIVELRQREIDVLLAVSDHAVERAQPVPAGSFGIRDPSR